MRIVVVVREHGGSGEVKELLELVQVGFDVRTGVSEISEAGNWSPKSPSCPNRPRLPVFAPRSILPSLFSNPHHLRHKTMFVAMDRIPEGLNWSCCKGQAGAGSPPERIGSALELPQLRVDWVGVPHRRSP